MARLPARARLHPAPELEVPGKPVGHRARVRAHDAVVRQPRRELPEHPLRVHRLGVAHGPGLDHAPPLGHLLLEAGPPAGVALGLEVRQQGLERAPTVAREIHLHRVAKPEHPGIEVDLDPARLAFARQELGVRKAGAHHEQGVAAHHHLPARLGAEESDGAGDVREVVGHGGLAEERFRDPGTEPVGHRQHLVGGVQRPGAHQHRDPLALVQHRRRAAEIGLGGHHRRRRVADAGMHGPVRPGRLGHRVDLLEIVGENQDAHAPPAGRDPDRPVHKVADLGRMDRHLDVLGHVPEQEGEVHLLLVRAAQRHAGLLPDDGQHRLVVHLGVVEAVEQVDRPGTGGRETDTQLAGVLGVAARHESGHLFVAHPDEVEPVPRLVERAEQLIDAVAGIAEDPAHPPGRQPFQYEVRDRCRHPSSPFLVEDRGPGRGSRWIGGAEPRGPPAPVRSASDVPRFQ